MPFESLSVSEVTTEQEMLALRKEWSELLECDSRATIFQTWEYQYYIPKIFADNVSQCFVVVRDEHGKLVGCAPLGIHTWSFGPISVRFLEFACTRYTDYASFIVHDERAEEVLDALARWLRENYQRWEGVRLWPLREDSWIASEELFLSKLGLPYLLEKSGTAPYLEFQPGWTSYEDALGKSTARSMRYKVGKLFRRMDVSFQKASSNGSLQSALEQLITLHRSRMHQKNLMGAFTEPKSAECFQSLVSELATQGKADIYSIGSGQEAIAAICTFKFRGSVSYFQGGFDPEYQNLSPGNVIHALTINQALKESVSEYDFLLGGDQYKFTWTNRERSIYSLVIDDKSWRLKIYEALTNLKRSLWRQRALRSVYLRIRK